jgi:hypothetical protein
MQQFFRPRLETAREIFSRPWTKWPIRIWIAIGAWDLVLAELVPEQLAGKLPRVYRVVEMTSGWLSPSSWLLIGMAIAVLASFEFAFRQTYDARVKERYLSWSKGAKKGFLDFEVYGQQGLVDMTSKVATANEETKNFGLGLQKYADKVLSAKTPKKRHKIASQTAIFIHNYAEKIRRAADFVSSIAPVVEESGIGMIARETNVISLRGLSEATNDLAVNILPGTLSSLAGMKASTQATAGISADLNAASANLDSVLTEYEQAIIAVRDSATRMHSAALERIKEVERT